MNRNARWGFDPDQFFGAEGPFGPRGPFGPGGPFGPAGVGQFFGAGADQDPWGGRDRRRGPGFGPGGPGGQRPGRGPGRRARRGEVRGAILHLLGQGPRNGYQLIQEIADATDGQWQPSSGAVYPALAQLEDEGLIRPTEVEGRKAFELTDEGRAATESTPDPLFAAAGTEPQDPWSGGEERGRRRGPGRGQARAAQEWMGQGLGPQAEAFAEEGRKAFQRGATLWKSLGGLAMATQAVGQSGDDQLAEQAAEMLQRTRKELYRLLADAEVDQDHGAEGDHDDDEVTEGELLD